MIQVNETEFYRVISPMNVHPFSEKDHTRWENIPTRKQIGMSTHGWMTPTGATKEEFYLTDELANATMLSGGKS